MTQSNLSSLALPLPNNPALQLSENLVSHIKQLVARQEGCIGFDQYMAACLYEPGLGYYSAGSCKFGAAGDFVTAPELSVIFSKCLANQCAEILNNLNTGNILELGAGTGLMARDILLELEKQNALPEQYWILEVSADLKQRQQKLLKNSIPHLGGRVKWLSSLPDDSFVGLIIANEVLDALPVKRFVKRGDTFNELKVGIDEKTFLWLEEKVDPNLLKALEQLQKKLKNAFREAYVSEINPNLNEWLRTLEGILQQGVMLFIDYGYSESDYYHPKRNEGTLRCYYQHRVHADPFFYPGLQDITASVNFTALAEASDFLGMKVEGYTSQAYFLFGCGLEGVLAEMNALDIKSQIEIAQQVRVLTLPEEMGERFKVLAVTKNHDHAMRGFSIMDQRVRL